ncbi:MAG: hypothetical protein U9Q84_03290 [Thermodesulfobacteriota bacterium]|nr:hypothetical protein [Thermodesulfobacteriota bacterium]
MDEFWDIMKSVADRLCKRRAYNCLFRFLPAYFAPNGLTDGWEQCRDTLKDTRALCRDDLTENEKRDLHRATNIIDRMLSNR